MASSIPEIPGSRERVFEGSDTREFRSRQGAEAYAKRLQERSRSSTVIIPTGKLCWFTAAGLAAEVNQ